MPPESRITRRDAIIGVSTTLLLPLGCATGGDPLRDVVFRHGVASGDPDANSVVIWTRVSNVAAPVDVSWQVASDSLFDNIVAEGRARTDSDRDYTAKIVVDGLEPGGEYFYRFSAAGVTSPIGRTKTLPERHVERLILAIASCSNYPWGYFNAYEAIAEDGEVDLVVHLGDYIYEYDADGYGGETGRRIGRVHEPAHETVSLDDYRRRIAQYRTDEGSLAMHARHPLIAIWDDHESANNPWMGGAQNHQPEEGDWAARRAASLQAYYEWMPVREPRAGRSRAEYWRHFRYGDLASLITLETRHTGRTRQISGNDYAAHCDTPEMRDNFERTVMAAPGRDMLSHEMRAFLAESLEESVDAKRRWRLIGNQVVMARRRAPVLDEAFFDDLKAGLDDAGRAMLDGLSSNGERDMLVDLDSWNGYPAARERFYETAKKSGVRDLLVLAGDSHGFWQNTLFDVNGQPMGVELGTTGITSPRSQLLDLGGGGLERFDRLNAEHNEEVVWAEGRYRGYIRLRLDHERARADYVAVTDVESRDYETRILRTVEILGRNGTLVYS